MNNFKEIFCTSIPLSKNKFRARVPQDPVLQTRSMAGFISPNMGKGIGDLEVGRKAGWGEAGAGVGDFEGALNNNGFENKEGGFGDVSPALSHGLPAETMEGRSGVHHPRRSSWGQKSGSWEISPDVLALASGVGESNRVGNGSGTQAANDR